MIKNIVKKFCNEKKNVGFYRALYLLSLELNYMKLHRKGLAEAGRYRNHKELRLHLGCGPIVKDGWLNIDLLDPKADLSLDLREAFPFADGSCSEIYSEHFLEHIEYPEGVYKFLKESYRVLEPGGKFGVGVPDTEWPLLEYAKVKKEGYFKRMKEMLWHPDWCDTELEHINYHFRQNGQHQFAYDLTTLLFVLKRCGFADVSARSFNPDMDSEERKIGTIYVDGYKPKE